MVEVEDGEAGDGGGGDAEEGDGEVVEEVVGCCGGVDG